MTDRPKPKKPEAKLSKASAAAQQALLAAATKQSLGDAAAYVDGQQKSRNQEIVERATKTATVNPPTGHSLETMDQAPRVVAMARASTEPDWGDNPSDLDTPAEVRASLQDAGLDPMDVDTQDEAQFGHFLVHAYADDEDRGGRTPQQLEAEHDMVVAAMQDFGVDHNSPLDLGGIEDGDDVGDPFGVGIDLSLGGDD